MKRTFALSVLAVTLGALCVMARSFEVGEKDFLLDGRPFVVRCGEVHYARIPRAYWRHRLQMLRAMGCNAVGCYMFWNFHEREKGVFTWDGRADVAAFCRMAQAEGLWVILRPGPYSCAEWEGGGAPWWLMGEGELGTGNGERKKPISMRSSDPRWLVPATNWLHAVGRQLSGLQVTKGGPILMVQVENEYGLHGADVAYMRALRQAALDVGRIPLHGVPDAPDERAACGGGVRRHDAPPPRNAGVRVDEGAREVHADDGDGIRPTGVTATRVGRLHASMTRRRRTSRFRPRRSMRSSMVRGRADAARRRIPQSRPSAGRTPTSTDASRSARTAARRDVSMP